MGLLKQLFAAVALYACGTRAIDGGILCTGEESGAMGFCACNAGAILCERDGVDIETDQFGVCDGEKVLTLCGRLALANWQAGLLCPKLGGGFQAVSQQQVRERAR